MKPQQDHGHSAVVMGSPTNETDRLYPGETSKSPASPPTPSSITEPPPNAVLRYGSLSLLVLQNCSAVLLTRYVQAPHRERFSIPAANLCVEVIKFALCGAAILTGASSEPDRKQLEKENVEVHHALAGGTAVASQPSNWITSRGIYDMKEAVFSKTSWQMAVPAALFTIQNNLLFVALANLDATLFQVSYQLKLLCTALLMVIMLGRELQPLKWASLFLLFVGIVLTQLKPGKDKPESQRSNSHNESFALGMAAVGTCSLCSAFAGVYFEKVLKSSGGGASLLVRNVQLAIYSFAFNWLVLMYNSMTAAPPSSSSSSSSPSSSSGAGTMASIASAAWDDASSSGAKFFTFLNGFDGLVWTLVLVQAAGGLLVAAVIKYADNILKGFATAVAIVLNGIISYLWLDWVPTGMFLIGAAVVIVATMMYSV